MGHKRPVGVKRETSIFGVPDSFTAIPLADPEKITPYNEGLVTLISTAIRQTTELFRAEIKLARTEIFSEIRKGVTGSVFFIISLTVLLFSSFFFFLFVAALLALWVPLWLSFLIVFGAMLVCSIFFALLGVLKILRIKAPRKTISSVRETANIRNQLHTD